MANDEDDNDFGKELAEAFAVDEAAGAPKLPEVPAEQPKPGEATPPAPETPPKPGEEPKKPDEPAKPEDSKKEEPAAPPASDEKKPKDGTTPPETSEAPKPPEEPAPPKPLTLDDIKGVVNDVRSEERQSGKAVEDTTKEVLDAYYPEGLSNVLVDQQSGKELRTPQDVIDASGGEMSMEQATQWLMNEQFKLDQSVAKIKEDAKGIAETTLKFKQDSIDVLTRYEPLFKAYPTVQQKIWNQYSKLIKADEKKGVILSAPDMREFYDTVLEPYRMAFEFAQKQSATNPVPPAPGTPGAPAEPPKPGAEDRMDEGGDGGASEVDDPNDFAQQVNKELSRGI